MGSKPEGLDGSELQRKVKSYMKRRAKQLQTHTELTCGIRARQAVGCGRSTWQEKTDLTVKPSDVRVR